MARFNKGDTIFINDGAYILRVGIIDIYKGEVLFNSRTYLCNYYELEFEDGTLETVNTWDLRGTKARKRLSKAEKVLFLA